MWKRLDSQDVGSEAATIQRMRNSSLVKRLRAENLPGLSVAPNSRMRGLEPRVVGDASMGGRSRTARSGGPPSSENAGVSSDGGRGSRPPYGQGFPGKVRPPGVSRGLRGGREAHPMHSMSRSMRPAQEAWQ